MNCARCGETLVMAGPCPRCGFQGPATYGAHAAPTITNRRGNKLPLPLIALGGILVVLVFCGVVAAMLQEALSASTSAPSASAGQGASGRPPPSEAVAIASAPPAPPRSVDAAAATDTNLDRLLALAVDDFDVAPDDYWALLPPNTLDCGTDFDGKVQRLDVPKGDDEFEVKRKTDTKDEIRKKYVGKLAKFADTGELQNDWLSVGKFQVKLSKYDFAKKEFDFILAADGSSMWPLQAEVPSFGAESFQVEWDRKVASVGGKDVKLRTASSEKLYENNSHIRISIDAAPEEAERLKKSATAGVEIVLEFLGMGLHKQCKRQCMTLLGSTDCGMDNVGFGEYYRARLLGYRIKLGGKVVGEKQPPDDVVRQFQERGRP